MIPVNEPSIGGKELEYVTECLKTGWISSTGRFIEEFEQEWASYCGMKYGVAVSNGTVALQVAIKSLDLKPQDEVIIPTFTIISCALAVIYNDAKPVLVDSEPRTWTMDTSKVEEKITARTKAIMPVHIYGHPCRMDEIRVLAQKYNLVIVEDAAEAHGAEYRGRKCGGLGDISCFSFYANKIITTGEGGMVLTNNEEYARRAKSLRNLCFMKERRFYHTEAGHNFRLTNLQAAIGLAQLERIDELIEKKRWIGQSYRERLKDIEGLILPVEESDVKSVYWMYGIVLDDSTGFNADSFAIELRKEGVETRPFFLGMHEQPVFNKMGLFKDEYYPVATKISRQGLYLPSGLTLKEQEIERVVASVKKILYEGQT
jgi:perosamine synthetase